MFGILVENDVLDGDFLLGCVHPLRSLSAGIGATATHGDWLLEAVHYPNEQSFLFSRLPDVQE